MGMNEIIKTPEEIEQIINHLKADIIELMGQQDELDINDSFGDYLAGVIERSQTVLRMLGVPENDIPNDGSC